jgi:AraC-like DNA-binding protein
MVTHSPPVRADTGAQKIGRQRRFDGDVRPARNQPYNEITTAASAWRCAVTISFAETESARDLQWSTDSVVTSSPVQSWGDVISRGMTEMDVTSPLENRFRARWRRYGLGAIDINLLSASAQRAVRSPAITARTRSADYDLVYMRRGAVNVIHNGSAFHVAEGSFVLLDNEKPFYLRFDTDSDGLVAHLPGHWLRQWIPHPETLVARAISGSGNWAAPLAATMITIADTGLADIALPRSVIADQCGALLALLAGPAGPASTRHNRDLLAVLTSQLQARFGESHLDPSTVAEAVGISKRHLHALFASAGTTFGATLLAIRLRRASEILTDPRFRLYQIGEVAWQCGFEDASHFARRFKRSFGVTPLNFRRSRR